MSVSSLSVARYTVRLIVSDLGDDIDLPLDALSLADCLVVLASITPDASLQLPPPGDAVVLAHQAAEVCLNLSCWV